MNPELPKNRPPTSPRPPTTRLPDLWWIKIVLPPMLLLLVGAMLIMGLGVAQHQGWISRGSGGDESAAAVADTRTYICPMLCTPPIIGPGRCPVCEMELVLASQSVIIDPVARRVANIQTVKVQSAPLQRTLHAIGQLNYDEGSLKTISAYVDGRLDRLYADYTGMVVSRGDNLALVYSPRLYSGQVELLLARQAFLDSQASNSQRVTSQRVIESNRDMVESAKQRLIELGMTATQIDQLLQAGKANSRLHLLAPISGTVIRKYATEGQYVKEGQAIYELANLSTVWLMLELFPEDAATIRYGQKVEAEVQSLPGHPFTGRVAFVDPMVDPVKRTVGVRVVMPNAEGLLRVGDYATATLRIAHTNGNSLVVPRNAVLMAGNHSVLYVETKPGRFELRKVVLGVSSGGLIAILDGVEEGEEVAVSGNFLIDSQMQLAGKPSLIDPNKVQPKEEFELDAESIPPIGAMGMAPTSTDNISTDNEVAEALAGLSVEDRRLAEQQRLCPVTDFELGSMGRPPKVMVQGQAVFICCEGCRSRLLANPDKYLAKLSAQAANGEGGK